MKRLLVFLVTAASLTVGVLHSVSAGHSKTTGVIAASSLSLPSITPEPLPPLAGLLSEDVAYEKVSQATFLVATYLDSERKAGATAFFVKDAGGRKFIVTNRHVCLERESPKGLQFTLTNGFGESFTTTMEKNSSTTDLCVLNVPDLLTRDRSPLEIESVPVVEGTRLEIYGHPRLRPLTMTAGRLLGISFQEIKMRGIFTPDYAMLIGMTSIHIEPGNSGSAVVDGRAKVVGVAFATADEEGHALFVPASELIKFLASIKR